MGNYRFKLSDMIPNAWFYKLRDMGKRKNQTLDKKKKKKESLSSSTTSKTSKPKQPNLRIPRKSYYFTRELNDPTDRDRIFTSPPSSNPKVSVSDTNFSETPRKSSSKQRPKRRTTTKTSPKLVSSSVSSSCHCRTTRDSVWTKSDSPHENSSSPFDSSVDSEFPEPEFRTDRVLPTESSLFDDNDCDGDGRLVFHENDIVIDVDKNYIARKDDKLDGFDSFSELELPPIITKPTKLKKENIVTKPRNRGRTFEEELREQGNLKVKILTEGMAANREQKTTQVRRFSVSSPGLKIRVNSPRISGRKSQGYSGRKSVSSSTAPRSSRRSVSDSFAVVKSSFNPQKDFRESMVEMIVENNIRASKDLEDLLACYLSLNSDEYHDLIIKVFKQIWFDLTDTH
ncbi:hypothetical protein QN277_025103 [Acacia crassicarpa]|uniref:Transcription repressor n=1 Tax=Acacia crassicarpa TaxID=499986 RepID=A0AAE1JDM4_9FABA|nr:hypothetical protein QN277_025103 [Acacia crassicarpa]